MPSHDFLERNITSLHGRIIPPAVLRVSHNNNWCMDRKVYMRLGHERVLSLTHARLIVLVRRKPYRAQMRWPRRAVKYYLRAARTRTFATRKRFRSILLAITVGAALHFSFRIRCEISVCTRRGGVERARRKNCNKRRRTHARTHAHKPGYNKSFAFPQLIYSAQQIFLKSHRRPRGRETAKKPTAKRNAKLKISRWRETRYSSRIPRSMSRILSVYRY